MLSRTQRHSEPRPQPRPACRSATLAYRTLPCCPPAREAVAWGDSEFVRHVATLLRLPHIEGEVGELLRDADRKALAKQLHATVSDLHTRVRF